ncbi:MAG TPA: protein kinase [Oculatellaceae cyanobacterium]
MGKLLHERYQIIEVLSGGAFGTIYLAQDTSQPHHPKCVVKQLKLVSKEPNNLQIVRRRFAYEAIALKKLGNHDQIPQLLGCFEENQEFYLAQELIAGNTLSEELSDNQQYKSWDETQVIQLLEELLQILDFVHSQGIIHCDIKPNNIIRRSSDQRLCLIDFGTVQPLHPPAPYRQKNVPVSMRLLGYISPEQLMGQTYPCSDIYALGMIAIQALTKLELRKLPVDLNSGELIWQYQESISDPLKTVLNQMVRYNFQDRYQSAREVLQALREHSLVKTMTIVSSNESEQINPLQLTGSNSPDLFRRVGFSVLALNSVMSAFGSYALLHISQTDTEVDFFINDLAEHYAGDLEKAIALAQSIISPETQASTVEWQHNGKNTNPQFQVIEKAFKENRWIDVLTEAKKIPHTASLHQKIQPMVQQAQLKVDTAVNPLLQKAYKQASVKDFTGAIRYIKQIPPQAKIYPEVQAKIAEYQQKQQLRATHLLQQAYKLAANNDFLGALKYLKQIPKGTRVYPSVQTKIAEYNKKQQLIAKVNKSKQLTTTSNKKPLKNGVMTRIQSVNWGQGLQEMSSITQAKSR